MKPSPTWVYVTVFYTLPYIISATEESQDNFTEAMRMLKSLDSARNDIRAIKRTVTALDDDLADKQKRTCSIGVNSHFCSLADLDSKIRSHEWLKSIYSPGKRSGDSGTENDENKTSKSDDQERMLRNIVLNRLNLAKLRHLLEDADTDLVEQRKRTCSIELGGACRTEWASSIADQYYYLMGPHSPGKRRRRSPIKLKMRTLPRETSSNFVERLRERM